MAKILLTKKEWEWWLNKRKKPLMMLKQTKDFIDNVLYQLTLEREENVLNKDTLKEIYRGV